METKSTTVRVDHQRLIRFVQLAFQKLDVPEQDAAVAAHVLVLADLRGVDSHGVLRFSPRGWYVKALRDGVINPRPNIRIVNETATTALVEGDGGMGMVVGHRAMELAIRKAERSGSAIVGVRNSRHFGMSAYYSMMALPHNMIGIAMTNAGRQVVPTFGRDARFGTNPISLAAPAGEERPFVLDMATTTAAAGKLEVAARWGKTVPLGWALDENAQPTADPKAAQKARRLLPLGGTPEGGSYKGYGLAILVEVLCGALTGTVAALSPPAYGVRGHFFGAINIEAFRPVEEFKRDMDTLVRELKSTPTLEGYERVYVAGEIEFETAEERIERGIPLHRSILDGLRELSDQLSVPYDLE
ncbi:MAG TPA: Ldh family oxidoreductase [Candidatus Eisenbacteria bacterium]|nr:Ldh family oxidoreductase [Candidatus Eisenbacteria bacterium]